MQNIKVCLWSKLYLQHWKSIFTFIAQNVDFSLCSPKKLINQILRGGLTSAICDITNNLEANHGPSSQV